MSDDRRYFIVKHGLDAFETLPNFIWNTENSLHDVPHRYPQVRRGDRWFGFAYTTSDYRERPLSLVTGFYECTQEYNYGSIPPKAVAMNCDGATKAWLIKGKPLGRKLRQPVGVPPIDDLLGKKTWKNQAITPITQKDFDHVEDYTLNHQLDTNTIPFLHREPHNEQELLAAVVFGHKKLGIEEIVRVRKAFPDLLVRIKGHPRDVHLELEVYSKGFFLHGHDEHVHSRRFDGDKKPVAILCWIDNCERVKRRVHKVYELQKLLRVGGKIRW